MLRQEINLYKSIKAPPPVSSPLTWKRLWISNLTVLVLFVIVYFFSLWNIHQLKQQKIALQKEAQDLQIQFLQLKATFPPVFFTQDVNQAITQLKHDLAMQTKLLSSIANNTSFSNQLLTLAQVIVPNVWLTEISMTAIDLIVKGHSIGVEALQQFIYNLLHDKTYSGYTLDVKSIENPSKNDITGNLTFEVRIVKG